MTGIVQILIIFTLIEKEKSDKEPSLQQKRCHNTKHVFWNPVISWKGL